MCFVAQMETGRLKTGSHRAADRKQKTLPIPPHTLCVLQSVCGSEKRSRRENKISLLKKEELIVQMKLLIVAEVL